MDDPRILIADLAGHDRAVAMAAHTRLVELSDAAVPALIEGLSDPDWRVRRACALVADRNPDPRLLERVRLAVHDPKARVRQIAVHALACEHCKPGVPLPDPVPTLVDRLKNDKAIRVRRMAAGSLIPYVDQRRVARAFRAVRLTETDPRLLKMLGWGLYRHKQLKAAATSS